jgi:hypothetical protein
MLQLFLQTITRKSAVRIEWEVLVSVISKPDLDFISNTCKINIVSQRISASQKPILLFNSLRDNNILQVDYYSIIYPEKLSYVYILYTDRVV